MKEKKEIRRQVLALRDSLTAREVEAKSRAVVERLIGLAEVREARTLMVYLAFAKEVNLDGLIEWGWGQQKRIAVPHCRPDTWSLTACRIDCFAELAPGHYGIRAPRDGGQRPITPEEIDAVIVPGAAFDRRGYRIGYGGGYYDRFLRTTAAASPIGAAFSCQLVPAIPLEPHDIPVCVVVTEGETIITQGKNRFANRPGRTPICP